MLFKICILDIYKFMLFFTRHHFIIHCLVTHFIQNVFLTFTIFVPYNDYKYTFLIDVNKLTI